MTTDEYAPIKTQALAWIDHVIGKRVKGVYQPQQAIKASEYEAGGENRVSVEPDVANVELAPDAPPQIELDNTPLTADEIAYGQQIADNIEMWGRGGMVYHAPDNNEPAASRFEAETSVIAYGVGDAEPVGESAVRNYHKPSNPKTGRKRTPKAVQIVLDYLMRNPADARLSTNVLTDKLKCDVRIKVGRSSVGKALSIVRANGQR